eukprot:15339853-Ditylum_brightwellii.AAC.1
MKHNSPWIKSADCVSITFEFQKNNERGDTLTQMASRDVILCPVWQWAKVVKHVWGTRELQKESRCQRCGVLTK